MNGSDHIVLTNEFISNAVEEYRSTQGEERAIGYEDAFLWMRKNGMMGLLEMLSMAGDLLPDEDLSKHYNTYPPGVMKSGEFCLKHGMGRKVAIDRIRELSKRIQQRSNERKKEE